jgi:PA domain-containing protein/flagellar hook capping protein FlgD
MKLRTLLSVGLLASLAGPAGAATITIVDGDGVNEGFNDPTSVAPVGGNPGTTLGQQRFNVFQKAADIWGSILPSPVTIVVSATFDTLSPCNATSGVLGQAGPTFLIHDWPTAPIAGTSYVSALADKLNGADLVPGSADISAQFNSAVDNNTCLGTSNWYYGFDGNAGTNIELLPVVLHELGHGLGFIPAVTLSTGAFSGGFPTIYSRFLLDTSTGVHWNAMSNGDRVISATNTGHVVWDGPATVADVPNVLGHQARVRVNAPAGIAGEYAAVHAISGAPLANPGVTAAVVQAQDGVGTSTDACEALTNAIAISGNIALVDRGTCAFTTKALNAQNAGAVGIVIVNNASGLPPDPMGGTDPNVVIPMTGISQADGATLKAQLGSGLNATLHVDPTLLTGADASNRILMFAPNPVQQGSSISHWDVSTFPNLLMEPALNPDVHGLVDITRQAMRDMGWFSGSSITGVGGGAPVVALTSSPNPFGPSTAISFTLSAAGQAELGVFAVDGRRVRRLQSQPLAAGPHRVVWDGLDDAGAQVPAGVYLFRLRGPGVDAEGRTVRLP